jgi:transglutaminase-like putative cysteine protease
MQIRYGFDIALELAQPTTILAMMDVHSDFRRCVAAETDLELSPAMAAERFVDGGGNIVTRLSAPAGSVSLRLEGVFVSEGREDEVDVGAEAVAASDFPPDMLPFLWPSRYCETDLLSDFAWANFGAVKGGWARVQAICDFVHQRLRFSYPEARPTRTASEALAEGVGVCRDFTHLAVALCRCLNIPARYCNGYLGDIGVPPDPAPMDFNAWFEAFLGDRWFIFDPRHNRPRIGRILISRGRDAADIPMITTFGPHALTRFVVVTEEIRECEAVPARGVRPDQAADIRSILCGGRATLELSEGG